MRLIAAALVGYFLLTLAGCEKPPLKEATKPAATATTAPATTPSNTSSHEPVREDMHVGMGERGRGISAGPVGTPVKALFAVKESLAMDLVQHDLDLFKAGDPDGRGPRTNQEFMEKIVKANSIELPPLPEGDRYVYDPATEKLMIEHNGPPATDK